MLGGTEHHMYFTILSGWVFAFSIGRSPCCIARHDTWKLCTHVLICRYSVVYVYALDKHSKHSQDSHSAIHPFSVETGVWVGRWTWPELSPRAMDHRHLPLDQLRIRKDASEIPSKPHSERLRICHYSHPRLRSHFRCHFLQVTRVATACDLPYDHCGGYQSTLILPDL